MDRAPEAEELFSRALRLPPPERRAFLATACGDAALRREVADLLTYADGDADPAFLRSPVPRPPWPEADTPAAADGGVAAASGLPASIAGYRIVRLLGYGGMGTIYEARQECPQRSVALKLLHPGPVTPHILRRFILEGQLLRCLASPGIARIYAAGVEQIADPCGRLYPLPFLAMELVEGQRLDAPGAWIDPSVPGRLRLFAKVCDAVEHAHRHGIVHRDLKPANILVTRDGQPKILDFGIARLAGAGLEPAARLTPTGQILGSIAYMSPERLRGEERPAGVGADVYSLGVVLYELLAGRLPFAVRGRSFADAAAVIEKSPAPRLGTHDPLLRGDLTTIAGKALAKDPRRRYRSAAALAADVRRHLDGRPIVARPASGWIRAAERLRRNQGLSAAVAAVLGFAAAAGVTYCLARRGEPAAGKDLVRR